MPGIAKEGESTIVQQARNNNNSYLHSNLRLPTQSAQIRHHVQDEHKPAAAVTR